MTKREDLPENEKQEAEKLLRFAPFTDAETGKVNWPLPPPRRMVLMWDKSQRIIDPATIMAVTGQKGHEWLYLFNKYEAATPQKLILQEGLQRLDELLFPYGIIRVHNSFLVNLAFIKERKGNELILLRSVGEAITISRNNVAFFEKALELYCMPPMPLPTIG